ncbi:MAG: DUF3450 family protein [Verrucomicrobiota bacterium]|nr:DUF3450 domain-containing protein [Limisphaera sp.]MDW8382452.1 DUF3450 family protein [Verrucomicrobiota bacterium]
MKFVSWAWLQAGLLAWASAGVAAERPADAPASATWIEQWVQTRQMISKVRADWQAEAEILRQTRSMLEGELAALQTALSQVQTQSAVVAAERALAEAQRKELDLALETLRSYLPAVEERLRRFTPSFPEPLRKTVQPLLDRLQDPSLDKNRSTWLRLQTVVTLLNEVEKFHSGVTLHPELRPGPEGKPVRVTVLYLGLGQAWYVDETGRLAGWGVPTLQGWQWREDAALADRVRLALQVYEGKHPARFVELPVEIQ